eukprot:1161933-Pelagomonas_calceolata.AAC.2
MEHMAVTRLRSADNQYLHCVKGHGASTFCWTMALTSGAFPVAVLLLLLQGRMEDCKARVLLTCNGGMRATKKIELKKIADQAMEMCASRGHIRSFSKLIACCSPTVLLLAPFEQVDSVLVYANDMDGPQGAAADTPFTLGRDEWWQQAVPDYPALCDVEWVPAEHPLFLLYTSGSTGVCVRAWGVQAKGSAAHNRRVHGECATVSVHPVLGTVGCLSSFMAPQAVKGRSSTYTLALDRPWNPSRNPEFRNTGGSQNHGTNQGMQQ